LLGILYLSVLNVYQCDFRNVMASVTVLHTWPLPCSTTFRKCCWPLELM